MQRVCSKCTPMGLQCLLFRSFCVHFTGGEINGKGSNYTTVFNLHFEMFAAVGPAKNCDRNQFRLVRLAAGCPLYAHVLDATV